MGLAMKQLSLVPFSFIRTLASGPANMSRFREGPEPDQFERWTLSERNSTAKSGKCNFGPGRHRPAASGPGHRRRRLHRSWRDLDVRPCRHPIRTVRNRLNKHGNLPIARNFRRIVTGHVENGKAVIVGDTAATQFLERPSRPRIRLTNFGIERGGQTETCPGHFVLHPLPMGSTFRRVEFLPEDPDALNALDGKAAFGEMGASAQIAEGGRHPYIHRTDSLNLARSHRLNRPGCNGR